MSLATIGLTFAGVVALLSSVFVGWFFIHYVPDRLEWSASKRLRIATWMVAMSIALQLLRFAVFRT